MAQAFVRTISRRVALGPRGRRLALLALSVSGLALPSAAWAQCSASGTTVTCSGTAPSYTNTSDNVVATVGTNASVSGPLVLTGNNSQLTVANSGSVVSSGDYPAIQMTGDGAQVTVTGSVTSTIVSSNATAITVGNNATVTDNGSLTAQATTPAVQFGRNGTFVLNTAATAAVTGNIVFGSPSVGGFSNGSDVSTFTNNNVYCYNTTTNCGLNGNVIAYGNLRVNNNGYWVGNLQQNTQGSAGTVTIDNSANGIFTGIITTLSATNLTNEGSMTVYSGSSIGGVDLVGNGFPGPSSVTNSGSLTVGISSQPAVLTIYGSFTQTPTGILNMAIAPGVTPTPGSTYSQLYAAAPTSTGAGSISLAGTLNLSVAPGYYASNSAYQMLFAQQGSITVDPNLKLTGNNLPFVTFCPGSGAPGSDGTCSTSATQGVISATINGITGQAYQFTATHTSDYAQSLLKAGVAINANQLAVARGLNPLIGLANTNPSGSEASFLSYFDVSSAQDAVSFLDSASPQGYYAYAIALRDQANAFERQIDLRMGDQNSRHDEDGWWLSSEGQFHFGGSTGYNSAENLFGMTGGYDFSGPHHVYGLAFNASWAAVSYAPGTMYGHNRDLGIAAYGGWNLGPLHLTGQVQYNFGHLGANKVMVFYASTGAPTEFTSNGSASEHLLDVNAKAGFIFKTKSLQIEPFVGVDLMHGGIDSFTESSTLTAASQLTVNGISANRTDLLAGLAITRSHGLFRPYLRSVYRSRISGASSEVTAFFDGLSDQPFTVLANPQAKGELDNNAGINWVFDDAGSLYIGYQDTIRNGLHAHGINGGIRIEF